MIKLRLMLAAAAAAAALTLMGVYGHARYAAGAAHIQDRWDVERARQQVAAIEAQRTAFAETERRITAAKEQDREDRTHEARRAGAAADVAAADARLQQRFVTTAGCGRPAGDPAAASVGQAASAPGDLLADVQRRLGAAARDVVAFADAAADAGASCAARYDALINEREPSWN